MAVLGIQNIDNFTKQVYLMEKACSGKVLEEALTAAGDVLADALIAATPVGGQSHKQKKGIRPPGNARNSIINVPAKSKTYGITRRLIGYSKQAYYLYWVEKGHDIVAGGRKARKAQGTTHSQSGKGRVVGHVPGHPFMARVFQSNIKRALEAAKEVVVRAIQSQGKAA